MVVYHSTNNAGGAPTAAIVKQFLQNLNAMVMEGYGTSETSAVLREDGSVVDGVSVTLEDVPSLVHELSFFVVYVSVRQNEYLRIRVTLCETMSVSFV